MITYGYSPVSADFTCRKSDRTVDTVEPAMSRHSYEQPASYIYIYVCLKIKTNVSGINLAPPSL